MAKTKVTENAHIRMSRKQKASPFNKANKPDALPHWLDITDVAAYLDVSYTTVYRWIKAGSIPVVRHGKKYRIDFPSLQKWSAK